MRKDETEVLVVGAGPVGMMSALLLAEAGVRIKIIDQGRRATTHSYACVLHPSALRLLARLGLLDSVREQGRRIDTIGLYDGQSRRAELKLSQLPGPSAYAVALPQSSFETLLEQRLSQKFHINVEWNHRLASLASNTERIVASVEKLTQSAKGYIVPEWDWEVQKEVEINAAFVVGADGHDSTVRRRLGIEYEVLGKPERFVVFEFDTDSDPGSEARIVIDDATANVLWPLPGNRCRWSFQLDSRDAEEFLLKDRETIRLVREDVDEIKRNYAQGLAGKRAPWFQARIKDIYWSVRICFQSGLASRFGTHRGWLVGDAAHQTGPIGVQSLNAGLCEADDLAAKLASILRQSSPLQLLENYAKVHRNGWKKLLETTNAQISSVPANDWTRQHCARILACLPATDEDLALLAGQLGLSF
jgi:2-polyprenyl-6-methoxyphenol hydroxylase-like FAD-dependent oxidoreductase